MGSDTPILIGVILAAVINIAIFVVAKRNNMRVRVNGATVVGFFITAFIMTFIVAAIMGVPMN